MSSRLVFLGAALAMVLSGCSQEVQKLSPEQKTIFKETLGSVATAYRVPNERVNANRGSFSLALDHNSSKGSSKPTKSLKDERTKSMDDHLGGEIDSQACSVNTSEKQVGSRAIVSFQVSGSQCPVLASFSVKGTEDSLHFKGHYGVQDEKYKGLNDVDAFILEATIKAKQSPSSASIRGNAKGSIHSQKHGNVTFAMDALVDISMQQKQDDSSFERSNRRLPSFGDKPSPKKPKATIENKASFVMRAAYSKFEAELKVESTDSGTKYYINGEEESESEMIQILNQGGFEPSNPASLFLLF